MAEQIPHVLHFVWLGGPMPAAFQRNIDGWRSLHPGWEVRVWGELDLDFLENRKEFDAARNFAEKADIARYEIVHRHGGVYVDCDIEPLRNVEPLVDGAQFVVGEEIPELYSNGWFAASAGHPVLRYVIDELPRAFAARPDAPTNERTGPYFLTRCVRRAMAAQHADIRILPRETLYPYSYDQGDISAVGFPGSFAVHHWAKSWVSPAAPPRSGRLVGEARTLARRAAVAAKTAAIGLAGRWSRLEPRVHRPTPYATPVGEGRLLVATRAGFPVLADGHDLGVTPSLVLDGVYDVAFARYLDNELRKGDVVVDVGANIGLFTLQMAHLVGLTGRVIALEPNPSCVALLRDSLYLNRMRGLSAEVMIHQVAAGGAAEERVLSAHRSHRGMGTMRTGGDHLEGLPETRHGDVETFTVSVVRLDDLLAPIPFVRLVKIDVEGAEHEVLAGMTRLIDEQRVQFIDIELLDVRAGSSWGDLCSVLRDLDRRPGVRWWKLGGDGRRRPVTLDAAIHSTGLPHLLIEFPTPAASAT